MKKLIMTLALSAIAAAPAFAATHAKKTDSARTAYASAVYPTAVIVDGKVVGADPDPNIRLQLLRDHDLLTD